MYLVLNHIKKINLNCVKKSKWNWWNIKVVCCKRHNLLDCYHRGPTIWIRCELWSMYANQWLLIFLDVFLRNTFNLMNTVMTCFHTLCSLDLHSIVHESFWVKWKNYHFDRIIIIFSKRFVHISVACSCTSERSQIM